ncbi:hypothetical protein GCM10011514_07370 [Emticicia aquatilis]|uniref:Gliding motility-associated C-terminal domain-containing protein n=1 Tax=Emticicia aquatilis TaxID=1537369 RepID=A0A916YHL6_9BACT|nr:gliding motility-associated C-terminal domain-containing protein [Emticicia aquatilis]GGD45906.1 hypothetical protein GCM10011514_07370 [Emticicia aquatilis]
MNRKLILTIFYLSFCILNCFASHIIGADLSLVRTGKSNPNYKAVLHMYIDEHKQGITENNPLEIVLLYRKRDNKLMMQIDLQQETPKHLSFKNKTCADFFDIHLFAKKMSKEIFLDPNLYDDDGGYYLIFDRCCRSPLITNIDNVGLASTALLLEFPSLKKYPNYSSPEFTVPNGEYLCKGKPFQMTMDVTDAEGDEIKYKIVEPLSGYTGNGNSFFVNFTPQTTYYPVKWAAGYGLNNQLPGNPSLSIDSKGTISLTPTETGFFNFAILVEEFKNGIKVGSNIRDYALPVLNCPNTTAPSKPIITYQGNPINQTIEICAGQTIKLETSDDPTWVFQWKNNLDNILDAALNNISVKDSGTYRVVKSFKSTCAEESESEPVKVKIIDLNSKVKIIADRLEACEGEKILLKLENVSQTADWYLGSGFIKKDKSLIADKSGDYSAKVVSTNPTCPTVKDNILLKIYPKPTISIPNVLGYQICIGDNLDLKTIESPNYTYQWLKNTVPISGATDSKLNVYEFGNYTVKVKNTTGNCEVESEEFKVTLKTSCGSISFGSTDNIYLPNTFSPNNDGKNDDWQVYNLDKYPDAEIFVYNRWGDPIFYSKGNTIKWDGKYKNELVPVGIYIYILDLKTVGFSPIEGKLTVLY